MIFPMLRLIAMAALLGLVVAACGNDDDTANVTSPGAPAGENNSDEPPDANGDDSNEDEEAPPNEGEIPLDDVPEPGRAVLEVDGQTFAGEISSCEFAESGGEVTGIIVRATLEQDGEAIEFGVNGGRAPGSDWIIQSTLTIDGGVAYNSSNVGRAEVSGQSMVVEGEYVWLEDDGSMTSGAGRFAATCR